MNSSPIEIIVSPLPGTVHNLTDHSSSLSMIRMYRRLSSCSSELTGLSEKHESDLRLSSSYYRSPLQCTCVVDSSDLIYSVEPMPKTPLLRVPHIENLEICLLRKLHVAMLSSIRNRQRDTLNNMYIDIRDLSSCWLEILINTRLRTSLLIRVFLNNFNYTSQRWIKCWNGNSGEPFLSASMLIEIDWGWRQYLLICIAACLLSRPTTSRFLCRSAFTSKMRLRINSARVAVLLKLLLQMRWGSATSSIILMRGETTAFEKKHR